MGPSNPRRVPWPPATITMATRPARSASSPAAIAWRPTARAPARRAAGPSTSTVASAPRTSVSNQPVDQAEVERVHISLEPRPAGAVELAPEPQQLLLPVRLKRRLRSPSASSPIRLPYPRGWLRSKPPPPEPVRRTTDAVLGEDRADVRGRGDVEGRVVDAESLGHGRPELVGAAVLDGDVVAGGMAGSMVDAARRRRTARRDAGERRSARRCRSCWPRRRCGRSGRRRR